jgi:hypothetical protein
MNSPPQGVAAYVAALAAWGDGLVAYREAIRAYMREVGDGGTLALGRRWAAAAAEADLAQREVDTVLNAGSLPDADAGGLPDIGRILHHSNQLEGAAGRLAAVAAEALADGALEASAVGMSRTYSENLRGLGRAATARGAAAAELQRAAAAAAALAGAALSSRMELDVFVAWCDGTASRGEVASELYASALLCYARRGSAPAAEHLEAAKAGAFGLPADSVESALAACAALEQYHPLQAMAYMPGRITIAGPNIAGPDIAGVDGVGPAVNLALSQARLDVVYDLARLTDRRSAGQYGPIATTTVGLNYRLVERLQSIRAEARRRDGGQRAADRPRLTAGELALTVDGRTLCGMAPPSAGRWAPFAGSRPHVAAYCAASAQIILGALRDERARGWGFDLLAQYEQAGRGGQLPPDLYDAAALAAALHDEFGRAYDAAPPAVRPSDYRRLVVPEASGPGDYISAAVSQVSFMTLEGRLRAQGARAAKSRVPPALVEREGRMTQMLQATETAHTLWKRIKAAYRDPPFDTFAGGARARGAHMDTFRRIAAEALREELAGCMTPTMKMYALTEVPRPTRVR